MTHPPIGAQDERPRFGLANLTESGPVCLVVAIVLALAMVPALPSIDDAYIVLQSVEAIVTGREVSYGVAPLTGITSPAYLLCLLFLRSIGLPGLFTVKVAVVGTVVAYVYATWRLAGSCGALGWRRYALMGVALASGSVPVTLTNGLETGAATALVLWSLVWTLEQRPLRAACAAGVLPWFRPDLSAVAAVIVIASAWQARTKLWRSAACAAAVSIPFTIWLRLETGAWLPQTMAAKLFFFAEGCLPAAEKITRSIEFLTIWMWLTTPIVLGLVAALLDRIGRLGLLAAALVVGVYTWLLPGALTHNDYRYVTALLVPWGLLGFARVLPKLNWSGAIAVGVWIAVCATSSWPWLRNRGAEAQEFADAAQWIAHSVPRDARILVHDAGAVSYYAPNQLTDLVGLKTPWSVEVHRRLTWPSCGAERSLAIAEIAQRSAPQYLVVIADWDRIFDISGALRRAGWELTPVRTPVRAIDRYTVYRLTSPDEARGGSRRTGQASSSTATSASPDSAAAR